MNVYELHARLATLVEEGLGDKLVFVSLTGDEVDPEMQERLDPHNWEVFQVELPPGDDIDFIHLDVMTEAEIDGQSDE